MNNDFYTLRERDITIQKEWDEYCKVNGSDDDIFWFVLDKLIDAEERASHHAAIASVCSTTAERYAAALDSIIDAASILDFVASSNSIQIKHALGFARSKARSARKEAE